MQLVDVSILVYAFREDAQEHERYLAWLEQLALSGVSFAVPNVVLSRFLRAVTNAQVFRPAAPWPKARAFAELIRAQPSYVQLEPGARHWGIFLRLCDDSGATGKLVADAYLAAIAIEHAGEWVTADRDFARFPGLRWRHPLE